MYTKACKKCDEPFTTNTHRKQQCDTCRKGRHEKRTRKRATNDITFIGVDGEGVDRPDGKHEYVMLSVGQKTLWNEGMALQLDSILRFLYECYQAQSDAAYVGFFLGYDFIQWEKLLPEREARLLLTNAGIASRKSQRTSRANPYPDAVVWNGWEIDIMAGRRFKLRPHVCHKSEWNDLCRNRTCRAPITPNGYELAGVPKHILPGEMEFIPGGVPEENYEGDPVAFWSFYNQHTHVVGQGKEKVKAFGWMYICDTGPFWQTSFLNVINPKSWGDNPVCDEHEYETVVQGKSERGTTYAYGETSYYEEMRKYNVLENDILARVTQRLNQGFMNDRIPIKIPKTDWYGPGRAAQLWMDQLHAIIADKQAREANRGLAPTDTRHNETGLLNLDVYMSLPTWFYEAAKDSYYGGWFEQFIHGHVGDVWEYDINSAYPFIIASLPCLHTSGIHNGKYTQGTGSEYPISRDNYTLVYGKVSGSNPYIGAMPYRNKIGLISRPNVTKGWYWLHELEAARSAGLVDAMDIEEWRSYSPCDCTPPFDPATIGIRSLYQLRLDFGKNTPQGKSAKLVYNSAYGKTAQSIGTPKYSNPVYASLITAGCRTLILEAIASHPEGAKAVSMVATDGIYFTSRHSSLEIDSSRLGAWDETFKRNLTQLMPGVYWDEETRESVLKGAGVKMKSRGVPAKDLAREIWRLDEMFAEQHYRVRDTEEYEWPEIQFTSNFLLESAKSALNRGKWNEAGKVTHGSTRHISSNPRTKRNPVPYFDETDGVVRTSPYHSHPEIESTPYHKSFGYQADGESVFGEAVTPDGDPMQYWKDLIG